MSGSVYERRRFGWLRRRLGRDDVGDELIVSAQGFPRLVVKDGDAIGWRRRDGGVAPLPKREPVRHPETVWDEDDWITVRPRWWR